MMKKLFFLLLVTTLTLCMLSSCGSIESTIEKAEQALQKQPYKMELAIAFDSTNNQYANTFRAMSMTVPVIIDGENLSLDMSMQISSGVSGQATMTLIDQMLYMEVNVSGSTQRRKAELTEEDLKTFQEENTTSMPVETDMFSEYTAEKADGKTIIRFSGITDAGRDALLQAVDIDEYAELSIDDIDYTITVARGKYEKMDLLCTYTMTQRGQKVTFSMHMVANLSYDNIQKPKAPANADDYTEIDFDELM